MEVTGISALASALRSYQSRRGGSRQRHREGVCSSRAVAAVSGGGGLPPAPSPPGISAARQPAQPSPDSPLIMETFLETLKALGAEPAVAAAQRLAVSGRRHETVFGQQWTREHLQQRNCDVCH